MLRARNWLHHGLVPDFLAPRLASLNTAHRTIRRGARVRYSTTEAAKRSNPGIHSTPPTSNITKPNAQYSKEDAQKDLLYELGKRVYLLNAKQKSKYTSNPRHTYQYHSTLGDEYIKRIDFAKGEKSYSDYVEKTVKGIPVDA